MSKQPPIKTYKQFEKKALGTYHALTRSASDNIVSVKQLRSELSKTGRMSEKQFDKWMIDLQADDKIVLSLDSKKPSTPEDKELANAGVKVGEANKVWAYRVEQDQINTQERLELETYADNRAKILEKADPGELPKAYQPPKRGVVRAAKVKFSEGNYGLRLN